MDPDWDDLRVFLAVARGESLSAAGRALKKDPATMGRRVTRLEEAMGAALFLRAPSGYGLTEEGLRLLDYAEEAERAILRGSEVLTGAPGQLTGQIRIGAPDGCANYLLPQVCAKIHAAHPLLELNVVALPRVVNLSRREADFAIAVSPPAAGRYTVQKISDYHLHLAAHRRYLRHAPALDSLEDLRAHTIVGYIPDMIFDKELDYLSDSGVEKVALASNSASVQFGFLRQKVGVGIAHDFALPFGPGVVKVLPDQFALTRSFYLVRHAADARIERLARVGDMLRSGLREEIARLEDLAA